MSCTWRGGSSAPPLRCGSSCICALISEKMQKRVPESPQFQQPHHSCSAGSPKLVAACMAPVCQWREACCHQTRRNSFSLLVDPAASPHLLNAATFLWSTCLLSIAAAAAWRPKSPPAPAPSVPLAVLFTVNYTALALSAGVTRHGFCWSLLWRLLARHICAPLMLSGYVWAWLGDGAVAAEGGRGERRTAGLGNTRPQTSEGSSAAASRLQPLNNQGYSVLQQSLQCAFDLLEQLQCAPERRD